MKKSPYRTLALAAGTLLMLAGVLVFAITRTPPPDANTVGLYTTLCSTAATILIAVAVKGTAEGISNAAAFGPGLKGIAKVLMTEQKPPEPPPEPPKP